MNELGCCYYIFMVGALIYLGGVKLTVHIKMSISSIWKTCKGVGWIATIVFGLSLYSVLFESMSYGILFVQVGSHSSVIKICL